MSYNKGSTELIKNTLVVKDGNTYIIFSPFSNKITRVDQHPFAGSQLYDELEKCGFFGEIPETTLPDTEWRGFNSLTLLTTRRCNFACLYCYANATPDGKHMPLKLATDSTKWFLSQLKHKNIRITFHGGGEPTLTRDLIRSVVEYIEANYNDKKRTYIITTNGTASTDFWDWMMQYRFGISVSIDGMPDIQNRNRPFVNGEGSSETVERGIRYLVSHGYPFSVRLTYSPVDNIEEIIKYLGGLGIKKIHLEPLFPYGRFYKVTKFGEESNNLVYSPKGKEFLGKFLKAMDTAKLLGIKILNGHLLNFTRGVGYFCGAASARAMTVTHDGFLTGCLEVVDQKDKDFNTFLLGKYTSEEHGFEIYQEKIKMMQKRHADLLPQCKTCYARYHCAGGCSVKAVRASGNFLNVDDPYCIFTKALIPILVRRIAKESNV